ncbi:MAG: hypothetical protein WA769_04075, partial [Pseudolabrys sp.]
THVCTTHGRAANGATYGATAYAAARGDASHKRATDGNATHSAFADGQPDRPATAVPTGTTPATRITSAAAVGAGTFQRAGADETANAGTAADEFT